MKFSDWEAYGKTHTGKIRSINQDAFLDLTEHKLWLVADGMGGHKDGEYASKAIVDALRSFKPKKTLGKTISEIYRQLQRVNQNLYQLALDDEYHQVVGSTVAILLSYEQFCITLWSGDSRIYLFRNGKLNQITDDHNYESFLLANGTSPEIIKAHPFSQSLTHAIGSDEEFFLEPHIQQTKPNDIFLLCSDGLNKEVTDKEIESKLQMYTKSIAEATDQLIELCLMRGARDNVTIVLVHISQTS